MISLEFLVASAIAVLTAAGIYLVLRRRTFPVVLGVAFLSMILPLSLKLYKSRFSSPSDRQP